MPLATYASVVLIAILYTVTSWAVVGGVSVGKIVPVAGKQLGNLFFALSGQYLDSFATTVMQILLCTSLFGAVLALHNASNRYIYVLGREGVMPSWLGARCTGGTARRTARASPRRCSPSSSWPASPPLALIPTSTWPPSMLGIGTLGIVILQAAAAASVLGFFRRRQDRHWWRTGLAPLLGLAGLVTTGILLVKNFALVTGTASAVVNMLPWLMVVATVGGIGYALWMRARRPERYEGVAAESPRPVAEPTVAGPVPSAELDVA